MCVTNTMLMLYGMLLILLFMFPSNEGKPETDIPKIATPQKEQDDAYCGTFYENSGKFNNFRQKRSPLEENSTLESAGNLGNTELSNETTTNTEVSVPPPNSNSSSVNSLTTEIYISELNSLDISNSSTNITITNSTDIDLNNSTLNITKNILNGRNDSQNCSTSPNGSLNNSTYIQNATQTESETNNELALNGGNYTESESRIINSSQANYSMDINDTVNAQEKLVLTNLSTNLINLTSNNVSETFTTEETFDSTTVDGNERRKREIQNPVADESNRNGSTTLNFTESYSVSPVEYNNVTNSNTTLLTDNISELNLTNSTQFKIPEAQIVPENSTDSDYNTTENAYSSINSTYNYTNISETNLTDFTTKYYTTKENITITNLTDNSDTDMNKNTTVNVINITDTESIMICQKQQMESNETNDLTKSFITNLTVTNSTDGCSQNVSNETERLKRGIDSIVIHTSQNVTNVNTTSNITDLAAEHNVLTESSPIISTSQSTLQEVEKQTEKACLIQGEECTNSTECCEHFECTMFDFIKWSKNCDFKPKDIQLASPPPDVRIPKQPILQQAM